MMSNESNAIEQTAKLSDLLTLLPPRTFAYGKKIAKLLTENGLVRPGGRPYTENTVHQIVTKGYFDYYVEPALIQLIEEEYALPIESLRPNYVRKHPKRLFKHRLVPANG